MKFLRYGNNLRYDSEGIYSFWAEITNLDLGRRTTQKIGYWSPTGSTHENYAKRTLQKRYDFYYETETAASIGQLIQFQNIS